MPRRERFQGGFHQTPALVGGQGTVTHMHFDMDLSHIFHTQFWGRKRVLLFAFDQQDRLSIAAYSTRTNRRVDL